MDEQRRALAEILAPVVAEIAAVPWDRALNERLNALFPPDGPLFNALEACCDDGIATGWMGLQGDDARKGGRVLHPGPDTAGLSVDVVQLIDFCGPHHRHPNGEVCAVMPAEPTGRFDGRPRGWAVYPAGSDHWPDATGGRVRVLFLLPGGAIVYTDEAASLRSGAAGGGYV